MKKKLSQAAVPLYMAAMLWLDLLFRSMYGYIGGWQNGANSVFQRPALGFTLLWVLLLGALSYLLPRVLSRILMVLTGLISGILVLVHAVMYHLFGSFFGFHDLLYAGDGVAFFSSSYLQMRKLLLLGVLLAMGMILVAVIYLPRRSHPWKRIIGGLVVFSGALVGLVCLNASMMVELQFSTTMGWNVAAENNMNEGLDPKKRAYTEFNDPNACLPLAGLYQYSFRDLMQTFLSGEARNRMKVISDLDAYFTSRPVHEKNPMTGALAGKNVIMIMVESLDSWMLTDAFMPRLSALAADSLRFDHFYTPLYLSAGTFSTEFTSLTGVIPPISGVSTDAYVENLLPASLPRLFAKAGYRVNSFHSAVPSIYNRGKIHSNLGFEAYHSYADMNMSDYMLDTQLLNGFEQMVRSEGPFFSFVITYSGHGPYTDGYDNISKPYWQAAQEAVSASGVTGPEDTLDQFTRAVSHIMQTDAFIGGLVDRLHETGLWENTVLIVYGDHYAKYLTDTDFLLDLKGVRDRNLLCNTPLLIYAPGCPCGTVEKYGATVDLYPTICNLFSFQVDLRYFVGEDLFSELPGLVYWRDGSFYDGSFYCDGMQSALEDQHTQLLYEQVQTRLNASWETFREDYFRYTDPVPKD